MCQTVTAIGKSNVTHSRTTRPPTTLDCRSGFILLSQTYLSESRIKTSFDPLHHPGRGDYTVVNQPSNRACVLCAAQQNPNNFCGYLTCSKPTHHSFADRRCTASVHRCFRSEHITSP